jgi:hypothetical protein
MQDEEEMKTSVCKSLSDFLELDASKISLYSTTAPLTKTAIDCTLHLKVVVDDDEPINKLFRGARAPCAVLRAFCHTLLTVLICNGFASRAGKLQIRTGT